MQCGVVTLFHSLIIKVKVKVKIRAYISAITTTQQQHQFVAHNNNNLLYQPYIITPVVGTSTVDPVPWPKSTADPHRRPKSFGWVSDRFWHGYIRCLFVHDFIWGTSGS
jgi:hypothetical protein